MLRSYAALAALVVVGGWGVPAFATEEQAKTAIDQMSTAFKNTDLPAIAGLTSGQHGVSLRKLAEPLAKAKAACDDLDATLKAKGIELKNPFAAALLPINDIEFTLIASEKIQEKKSDPGVFVARIKFGPSGRALEEDVEIKQEDGSFRISPPAELARQLRGYVPEKPGTESEFLKRQTKGLEKLAGVLIEVKKEVADGKLTKREMVVLALMEKIERDKIRDILKGVAPTETPEK